MKQLLFLVLFFIFSKTYCQVRDSVGTVTFKENKVKDYTVTNKLTKNDTVYILFENKKNQRKNSTRKKDRIISYSYLFDFKNSDTMYFSTGIEEYLSSEKKDKKIKASIKWVDKKFIRRNKDKIYTYKKIKKNGFEKTIEEIEDCIFYLIDIKTKKDGKYMVREINVLFPADI